MQKFNYSVSLLNISTVINSLLIAAWTDREDLRKEIKNYQDKENEASRRVMLTQNLGQGKVANIPPPKSPVKAH